MRARPSQTESQVDPSFQLASTCDSVRPGLKIVLKINCRDSNLPVLAENLLFLENIPGLPFSLNILLVFETFPSQRKIVFSLFNQSF